MLYTESIDGVAYTTSSDEGTESEIHLSTRYLGDVFKSRGMPGVKSEVRLYSDSFPVLSKALIKTCPFLQVHGVLVHELVHVWQQSTLNNIPGGLIEGIADYVRLLHDLAPPHWKEARSNNWLAGYQTTGYFLAWIEKQFPGFVERINAYLGSDGEWSDQCVWWIIGRDVYELWQEYQNQLPSSTEEPVTIPTHTADKP